MLFDLTNILSMRPLAFIGFLDSVMRFEENAFDTYTTLIIEFISSAALNILKFLARIEVEILFIFSLKIKSLKRKAGLAPKKNSYQN
jgi:hypothetical protein